MKRAALFALCVAAGALLFQAASADPAPVRVHGAIASFDGQFLTLKADSGKTVIVAIQPTTRIVHSQKMTISDLRTGDSVATLALKGNDEKLRAQAIRVFRTAMQAGDEGQYPAESNPARIVTNGTIAAVAAMPSGGTLTVTFHGAVEGSAEGCTGRAPAGGWGCTGSADLVVARGVPIIAVTDGDTSLLLPRAIVSAFSIQDTDKLLTATSITVEREGKPVQ
jgi:hypothetical protein